MSKVRLNWNIAEEIIEVWNNWLNKNNIDKHAMQLIAKAVKVIKEKA